MCNGRIGNRSGDESIWVWSTGRASGEHETTLQEDADDEDEGDCVNALAVWKGHLISGHDNGKLRVWNVATGECDQVLECHNSGVCALAVCG